MLIFWGIEEARVMFALRKKKKPIWLFQNLFFYNTNIKPHEININKMLHLHQD